MCLLVGCRISRSCIKMLEKGGFEEGFPPDSKRTKRYRDLRDDHGQCDEVHAHRVGDGVVENINILAEAIRNTAQRCRVEKGHWRPQNASDGSVQHSLSSFCTEDGDGP
jgi:hypothetical protein